MNTKVKQRASLRGFLREKQPTNTYETLACLFYYAEQFEGVNQGDLEFAREMYRRAGRLAKAPDELDQALRDARNKYGFLKRVEPGVFKLSPEGRDFVENELPHVVETKCR